MRTIEEHQALLPPVSCADIANMAGQALIICQDGETEIEVRDFLFTPFGLTATMRFNPDGTIADKKLSAGSWHDLLNPAIELLSERAGIDPRDENQWGLMADIFTQWQSVLDDGAIVADLAAERIYVLPNLHVDLTLFQRVLDNSITMEDASRHAIDAEKFEQESSVRRCGVVLDDDWSMMEAERDEAIADAAMEDEIVLFGTLEVEEQYMHTIGLSTYGWPELVVRDLDPHLSPFLMRQIIMLHEKAGTAPSPGMIPYAIMPGGLRLRHLEMDVVHKDFARADGGTGVLEIVFPI